MFLTGVTLGVSLAYHHWFGLLVLLPYLLHLAVKVCVYRKAARLLGQSPLWASLPLLEIALPLMHLYVRVYRLFRGQKDYTFRLDNKH